MKGKTYNILGVKYTEKREDLAKNGLHGYCQQGVRYMIFPLEVDYLTWSHRYRIKVSSGKCPKCDMKILTNVPFAIKGYRGLKSEDHGCGEKFTRKSLVPTSEKEISYWMKAASSL